MSLVFNLVCKIFIMLLIGCFACKIGIVDDIAKDRLSKLLVNIVLPISMIASSQQKFSMSNLQGLGVVTVITFLYYVLALGVGVMVVKVLGRKRCDNKGTEFSSVPGTSDARDGAISILLITFANTAFLGIPIVTELVGETGTLYAVIYNCVFDLFYFSVGIYMLKAGTDGKKIDVKTLFGNPMVWVSVLVIIMYVIPFRMPVVVVDSLSAVGSMMMPLSMLVIGAQLCKMNFKSLFVNSRAIVLSIIRMVVIPLAVYGVLYFVGCSKDVLTTVVILSAMPSGSLNVIMAENYKTNPELATTVVMQTTVIMMVSLPMIMMMCM